MTEAPVQITSSRNGTETRHVRVAILGAGFGGLGAAIRLERDLGERDVVIFERHSEVGGTWWANSYPGAQCDIPSHLYSLSFAPNPNWTRTFPLQPELAEYMRDIAHRFGLHDRIRFNTTVEELRWDDERSIWHVKTDRGDWTADMVIAAPGPLSEPRWPEIPGLDKFKGRLIHTAEWDHSVDLRGKRVAVIGTGASAIQVVPAIAPTVAKLSVFQRTPPWIVPHTDRPITALERFLYRRFPILQRIPRAWVYITRELLVPGLVYRPNMLRVLERISKRHMERQIRDPELRRKVTPNYRLGCKRILPTNKWYPALQRDNVELVTDSITEIRPEGVVTADGRVHELDVIVAATGFHVTDIPLAHHIYGRGGRNLGREWEGSPQAYRGTTIAGYPNLFWLVGPNTGLGHNSIVFMIEAQLNYIIDALRRIGRNRTIEVREDVQRRFNERIQAKMPKTVWTTGGCASWYIDAKGRNTTIWPGFTFSYWWLMRRFDPESYTIAPVRPPARVAEPAAA